MGNVVASASSSCRAFVFFEKGKSVLSYLANKIKMVANTCFIKASLTFDFGMCSSKKLQECIRFNVAATIQTQVKDLNSEDNAQIPDLPLERAIIKYGSEQICNKILDKIEGLSRVAEISQQQDLLYRVSTSRTAYLEHEIAKLKKEGKSETEINDRVVIVLDYFENRKRKMV